ncbi:MAG: hypothetical protein VKJ64_14840, partial [Leptolyngbyaceae bacterium]|nr:hypothetical protein [Leptolyngbyaceae bacterium]
MPHFSTVRVVIVDEDPIFRVGLRDWLKQFSNFEVIEDIGDQAIAFRRLQARLDGPSNLTPATEEGISTPGSDLLSDEGDHSQNFDDSAAESTDSSSRDFPASDAIRSESVTEPMLVILGGAIALDAPSHSSLVHLCQQIKTHYPALAVLVLGSEAPAVIDAIQATAVDGYLSKAVAASYLEQTIQQVLAGEFQWPTPSPSLQTHPDDAPSSDHGTVSPTPATTPARRVGPLAQLRCRWRLLTLGQIDSQLQRLQPYAIAIRSKNPQSTKWSMVDRWTILGRYRELRTARWLVKRLLATPALEYLDWTGVYRAPDFTNRANDRANDEKGTIRDQPTPQPPGLFARWQQQLGAIAQQPIAPSAIRPSDRTPPASAIQLQPGNISAANPLA